MVDIKSCSIQSSLQVGVYYFVGMLGVWCISEGPLVINIQNTLQLPMQELEQMVLKHSPNATPVLTTTLIIIPQFWPTLSNPIYHLYIPKRMSIT